VGGTVIYSFTVWVPYQQLRPLAVKLAPKKMKICKYIPLYFIIRHYYSRLSCVTRSC